MENSSVKMKLSVDAIEPWHLLQTAQQFFSTNKQQHKSKTRRDRSPSLEAQRLQNYEDFFQIDVQMILLHVDPDYELPVDTFEQAVCAINDVLEAFDKLLDDDILSFDEAGSFSSPSSSPGARTENKKRPLKDKLRDSIFRIPKGRSQSTPCTETRLPSRRSSNMRPLAKLKLVEKQLNIAERDREAMRNLDIFLRQLHENDYEVILESMSVFNRVMREVYRPVAEPRQPATATKADGTTQGKGNGSEINYAARDLMQSLHHSLKKGLADCESGHAARLHLPVLQTDKESVEADVFFSTCQDRWQEAKCHVGSPKTPGRDFVEVHSLCDTITRSQGWRQLLRLVAIDGVLWDNSRPREKLSSPMASPIISLRSLLDHSLLPDQSNKRALYKISLKQKRILAVILAHIMIHLCGGPWMTDTWGADSIFFLHNPAGSSLNLCQPYIASRLNIDEPRNAAYTDEQIHKYPPILDFARLLLELEHGETLQSTEDDYDAITHEETPDTMFFMLNRVLEEASDDIYSDYRSAIEACLECDNFLPHQGALFDDLGFREQIYNNIVTPLEEELFKGFKIRVHELNSMQRPPEDRGIKQHAMFHIPQSVETGGLLKRQKSAKLQGSAISDIWTESSSTIALSLPSKYQSSNTSLFTHDYSHDSYTVAVICPMGVEMAPVLAMLDETHPNLSFARPRNTYTLGRIGQHNVVVTVMPETGNNSAAAVATQLQNDFQCLQFGLLVGIGGGIPDPNKYDLRLGDVVVSKPTTAFGGVVQFDRGKVTSNGHFERTGLLNKPPMILRTSLETLIAQHRVDGNRLNDHLEKMVHKKPHMAKEYSHPGEANDVLFHHSYNHNIGTGYETCGKEMIVTREPRESTTPRIHYGTIGSANIVVKDGETREKLKKDHGIMCVEMEAAGLMEDFPCLVIRGICDYADSHKLKTWQPYAAATAAAFAKELLLVVPAYNNRYIHVCLI